jgi:hypothetical protein
MIPFHSSSKFALKASGVTGQTEPADCSEAPVLQPFSSSAIRFFLEILNSFSQYFLMIPFHSSSKFALKASGVTGQTEPADCSEAPVLQPFAFSSKYLHWLLKLSFS